MKHEGVQVGLPLEYDQSRNFQMELETDSEEFASVSDLEKSSEDPDFIAHLRDALWQDDKNGPVVEFQFDASKKEAVLQLIGVVQMDPAQKFSKEEDNETPYETSEHHNNISASGESVSVEDGQHSAPFSFQGNQSHGL